MGRLLHLSITALLFVFAWIGYQHYDPMLPPYVAQHFDGGGQPNGFATHAVFWGIGFGAGVVMFVSIHVPALCLHLIPNRLFSLPNRDHYLSPTQREASLAYLENSVLAYGNFLLAWMLFVMWRVCEANVQMAPLRHFGPGMVVMLVVTVLWTVALLLRFRSPSR